MRAVQYAEYGDPGVLTVADVDEPHAGEGQIRVAVRAAGVNPFDHKLRSGMLSEVMPVDLPKIPGADAAGVVDEVGDGVTGVEVGDEVFGAAIGGASAEHTLMEHYARKPADLTWEEAGGLTTAVETAVRALDLLGLREGQTLLVNGAAGGVGTAAVQFARARGATVIGTAGESNHDHLRSLGAEPTTYGDGLPDRVRDLAPDGVNLALDTAGKGALPDLIEITGSPDNVVTIADQDAEKHGVRMTSGAEGRSWEALEQAADLIEQGKLKMPVAKTFTFEEAGEAHRESEEGHVRGKLVLVP